MIRKPIFPRDKREAFTDSPVDLTNKPPEGGFSVQA
jgi:hypothetical protein